MITLADINEYFNHSFLVYLLEVEEGKGLATGGYGKQNLSPGVGCAWVPVLLYFCL